MNLLFLWDSKYSIRWKTVMKITDLGNLRGKRKLPKFLELSQIQLFDIMTPQMMT